LSGTAGAWRGQPVSVRLEAGGEDALPLEDERCGSAEDAAVAA
jgi:hypothetical protein